MIAPVLENLAAEYADKVTIAKVNTDENSQWANTYGVQGIPTLLFIKEGKIQDTVVGVTSIANIKFKMDGLLKAPVGA
jgi:thioredoxin 1